MKTKLNCSAGWHALDLEELTGRALDRLGPAGDKQQQNRGGGGDRSDGRRNSLSLSGTAGP